MRLIGLMLLFAATPANAGQVAFEWRAPEGCPAEVELTSAITALLGHGLESPEGVERVSGAIDRRGARFVLTLRFEGGPGEPQRRLEDRDCSALGEAASLIVALALDPVAVAENTADPKPLRTRTSTPTDRFLDSPFTSDLPARKRRPPDDEAATDSELSAPGIPFTIPYPRFSVRAMIGGDAGIGPAGGTLQIAGGIVWSRLRFEGSLARFLPRSDGTGDIALWTAGVRNCVDPIATEIELPLCLGAEGGLFESTRDGGETTRGPWIAAVLGLSLVYHGADPLALIGTFEGFLPFLRPAGPDGEPGAVVAGRALFGAEVRFP